jgi:hypothetical protein
MTPPHTDREKPPDDELTPDDIQWIRQQRKQDAHAEWLRGQIKVIYPWALSVIGALVAAIIWIRDHVRF